VIKSIETDVYSSTFDESFKMLLIAASEADVDNIEGLPASRRETNRYKRSDRNIVR